MKAKNPKAEMPPVLIASLPYDQQLLKVEQAISKWLANQGNLNEIGGNGNWVITSSVTIIGNNGVRLVSAFPLVLVGELTQG